MSKRKRELNVAGSRLHSLRLLNVSLFEGKSAMMEHLSLSLPLERYPLGTLICEFGEIPSSIIFLVRGNALLIPNPTTACPIFPESFRPNRIFGLSEMLAAQPFDYSLQPITECFVRRITSCEFEQLLSKNASCRQVLIRDLARQTDNLYRKVREI
jgi:CRP-like cAMP-binding protein